MIIIIVFVVVVVVVVVIVVVAVIVFVVIFVIVVLVVIVVVVFNVPYLECPYIPAVSRRSAPCTAGPQSSGCQPHPWRTSPRSRGRYTETDRDRQSLETK